MGQLHKPSLDSMSVHYHLQPRTFLTKSLPYFLSFSNGNLAGAAESCKKGTLKVDLQALTVGVAVLSMASWLTTIRQALAKDKPGCLDSARKLAIVNGLGEHSRAQVTSSVLSRLTSYGQVRLVLDQDMNPTYDKISPCCILQVSLAFI